MPRRPRAESRLAPRPVVEVPPPGEWVRNPARGCAPGPGAPDPEMFFPVIETGFQITIAAARSVCWACPVREQCAAYALSVPSLQGIWGGMTNRERQIARRRATLDASLRQR